MKVISGSLAGRALVSPSGKLTRPVTDKVRSAIFSSLGERIVGASVLDLYAGSGALGIEALSRGATKLDLVDKSASAQKAIRENLIALDLSANTKLHSRSVEAFVKSAEGAYDIIFFDPPYAQFDIGLVKTLSHLIQYSGLVVVSCSAKVDLPSEFGELKLIQQKVYGDTRIGYYGG